MADRELYEVRLANGCQVFDCQACPGCLNCSCFDTRCDCPDEERTADIGDCYALVICPACELGNHVNCVRGPCQCYAEACTARRAAADPSTAEARP